MDNKKMKQEAQTNYEIAKARTAKIFLEYDLEEMIKKTGFEADASYIYMNFVGQFYRISRETGLVEYLSVDGSFSKDSIPADATFLEAEYSSAMTIYDIICYSDPACHAAQTYTAMQNLAPMYNSAKGSSSFAGEGMYAPMERLFDKEAETFEKACKKLGGRVWGKGDVSYIIPMFTYNGPIEVALDFWLSDEEFPAQLTILCDHNLLQYIHYETVWFMIGHLMGRIKELMKEGAAES